MSKFNNLKILKDQLNKTNNVKTYSDLDKWYIETKEYLRAIYGYNSTEYKNFRMYNSKPKPPVEKSLNNLTVTLSTYISIIENKVISFDLIQKETPCLSVSNDVLCMQNEVNKLSKENFFKRYLKSIIGFLLGLIGILSWLEITPNDLLQFFKDLLK